MTLAGKINKKTIARIAAVQAMYQYILQDKDSKNINTIIQEIISFYQDEKIAENSLPLKVKLNISHFNELVKLVIENIEQIDKIITAYSVTTKDIEQIPVLLLALLRVSIGELLFFANTPAKVVINEFTNLANDMLNENEIGFVNSVLDKIAREYNKIPC